ncbi:MAG: FAD binding domain-containing protein [Planctomycetota bacterium]
MSYEQPTTLAAAVQLRRAHPDYLLLAGGTDVMVDLPHREPPVGVIDLQNIAELRGVTATADEISIGAATTMAQLIANAEVRSHLPLLVDAAREVGALQIQERATIGGNIGTSSPVGDTLPALLALNAELELTSTAGSRRVSYAQFCTGYRKTQLAAEELVSALHIPYPTAGTRQYWRKVGTRQAQAISKVMIAAALRQDADGRFVATRIAFGAVAECPMRLTTVEQLIDGERASPELATAAAAEVARAITPIDDVRSTARYRLRVAQNLVQRLVESVEKEPHH